TTGTGLDNWDPALVTTASFSYRVRAVDTSGNLGAYSATGTVAASTTVNRPPVITGSPPTTVVAGTAYAFTPTASDPDGQALTFSVVGAPAWATFSSATGTLRGMPGSANVGRTDGIVITTTDGSNSVSLPGFSINVVEVASGTATVSWTPPVQRTDGSALTNLAGYEIRYGTSAAVLDRTIQLTNAGLTSYMVQGLTSGTWYFGVVAVDSARLASTLSSVRSKTVP
ncbi:MAG: putative Ig domain-containing protein, partial [Gammaproteobacteria bacterium]|nr:putative Ig domain-containing protein [Gammaproteobacteria bacterium]